MDFLIASRFCRVLYLENVLNHQEAAFSFMGNAKLGLYFANKALKSNVWHYSLYMCTYVYIYIYTLKKTSVDRERQNKGHKERWISESGVPWVISNSFH